MQEKDQEYNALVKILKDRVSKELNFKFVKFLILKYIVYRKYVKFNFVVL